jgi:hypothetical protein
LFSGIYSWVLLEMMKRKKSMPTLVGMLPGDKTPANFMLSKNNKPSITAGPDHQYSDDN